MWRKHVMIDETEPGRAEDVGGLELEPMVKKAASMVVAYSVAIVFMLVALAFLDIAGCMGRGWIVMILLWVSHLKSASWRVGNRWSKSTRLGQALLRVRSLGKSRSGLVAMLAITPLVSGLLAMQWPRQSILLGLSKFGNASLIWLGAMGVVMSWAAMLAPTALAKLEDAPGNRSARVWAVVRSTIGPFAMSMGGWWMFCFLAG